MLVPGTTFGDYEIGELIGQGGMGTVYKALQVALDRQVALKVLSSDLSADDDFRDMFRQEARSAASLDHANVLPVYHAGEGPGGALFLAMRLVRGPDLGARLRERGRLSVAEAVRLLTQVAEGLDAAHSAGLVHRDVKPGNVLLEPRADGMQAYLSDFGLARPVVSGAVTVRNEIAGTIGYMAPEQIQGGRVDGAVDVYAFGCLMYRCLVGRLPFERPTRDEVLIAHLNAPPPRPSHAVDGIPPILDLVVLRSLEKDASSRARSPVQMMRHASRELRVDPVSTIREPRRDFHISVPAPAAVPAKARTASTRDGNRRLVTLLVIAAVVLAAVVGTGIVVALRAQPEQDRETRIERAQNALLLTSRTVRLSAAEAGVVRDTPSSSDSAELVDKIERIRREAQLLIAESRGRIPGPDVMESRLEGAQRSSLHAADAIRRILLNPASPRAGELSSKARLSYSSMLDELQRMTRQLQQVLSSDRAFRSSGAREALRSMTSDLAIARERSASAFDELDQWIANQVAGARVTPSNTEVPLTPTGSPTQDP